MYDHDLLEDSNLQRLIGAQERDLARHRTAPARHRPAGRPAAPPRRGGQHGGGRRARHGDRQPLRLGRRRRTGSRSPGRGGPVVRPARGPGGCRRVGHGALPRRPGPHGRDPPGAAPSRDRHPAPGRAGAAHGARRRPRPAPGDVDGRHRRLRVGQDQPARRRPRRHRRRPRPRRGLDRQGTQGRGEDHLRPAGHAVQDLLVLGSRDTSWSDLESHDLRIPVNLPRFYVPPGQLADDLRAAAG